MVLVYSLTMGLSALLLFWLQPLFAKMILPLLGGSPGVWNTAMVFYQGVLLLGYAYSHFSLQWLGARYQSILHIIILLVAIVGLPIAVPMGWTPPLDSNPIGWVLVVLAVAVGMPFFAVSITAPSLQAWFARTGHKHAADPYFLYAASNVGSLAALLGFPLVLEPLLTLGQQSQLWASSFGLLILAIAVCVFLFHRRASKLEEVLNPLESQVSIVTWRRRLHWLALAAVPSSLLLGTTQHITTDIASVPLLWVVPLALYLLTHIIVFSRRPALRTSWMLEIQPFLIVVLAFTFAWDLQFFWFNLIMHLLVFFVTAMICHGELARTRPAASHLTEFFLWMSLGGVIGGAITALVAPMVFDQVFEYPIALVLAIALRPGSGKTKTWATNIDLIVLALLTIFALQFYVSDFHLAEVDVKLMVPMLFMIAAAAYIIRRRPLAFALGIFLLFVAGANFLKKDENVLARARSFFAVHRVVEDSTLGVRLMYSGTTIHGAQLTAANQIRKALSYYYRSSPVGQILTTNIRGPVWPSNAAFIGLGTGTLACYRKPAQNWTFYEIDPDVLKIARNREYFQTLSSCFADGKVILGDARLTLSKETANSFDMILGDAFSSDAIPVHLITREAIAMYMSKLKADGILVLHISNRNLNLVPVLARIADDLGLLIRHRQSKPPKGPKFKYYFKTDWLVLARQIPDLGLLAKDARWRQPSAVGGDLWTDDFSNIIGVLRR